MANGRCKGGAWWGAEGSKGEKDAKNSNGPRFRGDRYLANSNRRLELSAVQLGREVACHFHASLGLGDLGFQPLFHGRLLR